MGYHMNNYKNFGDMPNGGKPPRIYPLARQSSVYSLTFDEFQNTLGGFGKDFGSMNMDELLKNIWSAEETQSTGGGGGSIPVGNLQRQGSLTLPQTLSQKTVDEVWTDLINESGSGGSRVSNLPQRQQTLGEMTLEEFLVRAGVTREDTQLIGRPNNNGFYGELSRPGLALGFQQPSQNNGFLGNRLVESNNSVPNQLPSLALNVGGVGSSQQQQPIGGPNNSGFYGELSQLNNNGGLALGFQQQSQNNGFLGNRIMESNNSVPSQPSSLAINVGGLGSSQQQQHQNQSQQQQQQHQSQQHQHQHQNQNQNQSQQQRPLFPKQSTLAFASSRNLVNSAQIANPGARGTIGIADPLTNSNLVQGSGMPGGGIGTVGLRTGGVTRSPTDQISPDVIVKSNAVTSSLSPAPYVFNRGRKSNGVLEKGVERRQRRMIKNRESAARSRARKQAYTLELEAEITKLKEMNQKLERKQAEVMEIKKNQILETMNRQWGAKRQCLRRTLTGPW